MAITSLRNKFSRGCSRAGFVRIAAAAVVAFAAGLASGGTQSSTPPRFDGARAWQHLLTQAAWGPRVPGSVAMQKTRELILSELGRNGFSTGTQGFSAQVAVLGKTTHGLNIFGSRPPGSRPRYVLSAHYDTRPVADRDANPAKQGSPIPGANDGASGVAVLLELARTLHASPAPCAVGLAFFDAEDYGLAHEASGFCLGSRHMAMHMPRELAGFETGINLDMVGEAGARFPIEPKSMTSAPDAVEAIWAIGCSRHPGTFVREVGPPVYDDHMPFQENGFRYLNIIDFEYYHWHTTEDSADKCSQESLDAVGDTLVHFVYR